MKLRENTLGRIILVFLCWLILWNGSGEFRPSMDAMTYGALAKHVLSTGDWARLHYSTQAYSDFYQHPPLAIWMGALVFRWFGVSDLTSKILPNLFAALCVAGVYFWGVRWRTSRWAFVAAFVLLTSFRFTKFSVGFLLDPILAGFLVWSLVLAQLGFEEGRRGGWFGSRTMLFVSGLLAGAAFMAKGLPALVILPVVFVLAVGAQWIALASFGVGLALPLGLWFQLGRGVDYLQHYWAESVAGRVHADSFESHFAPLKNLLTVYWPWVPFWLVGTALWVWALRRTPLLVWFRRPLTAPVLMAALIFAGFTYSGHFLEHYWVPFYPFAALVVAEQVAPFFERFFEKIVRTLFWVSVGYAMVLAALPVHVQGNGYLDPMRNLLVRAVQECDTQKIERLAISEGVNGIWWNLAAGLWYTPWDVHSLPAALSPAQAGAQVLLAKRNEAAHPDWQGTELVDHDLRILVKKGLTVCPMRE